MDHQTRTISGAVKALGDRRISMTCSDGKVDRCNDIVVVKGIDLTNFKRNPIILRDHDPSRPVARAITIGISQDGTLAATVEFAPAGASAIADETYALIQAKILNACSIGFNPTSQPVPIGRGGVRFDTCELLEVSIVAVPAAAGALITSRALSNSDNPWPQKSAQIQAEAIRKGMSVQAAGIHAAKMIAEMRRSRDANRHSGLL